MSKLASLLTSAGLWRLTTYAWVGAAVGGPTSVESLADPTSMFAPVGRMNAARWVHAEIVLNDKVLVTGGSFQIAGEWFDPATNAFTAIPAGAMNVRVYGSATALPDGKLFLAGGTDGRIDLQNTAEIFDPATATSRMVQARMNSSRISHTATLVSSTKVLLSGGQGPGGVLDTAELFDLVTETFSQVATNMSARRFGHTATLLPGDKVLIAGGYSGQSFSNTADVFDRATGTFITVGLPMHSARYGHTATWLPNGKVLIAGGWDGTGALASAEIFDPATQTFALLSNAMKARREGHTATLLNTGYVLIAGGDSDGQTPMNAAELFNPTLETFTSLDPDGMTMPRRLHSAARLQDGRVLLTGGYVNWQPIDTAEVFDCSAEFGTLSTNITEEAAGPNGTNIIVVRWPASANDWVLQESGSMGDGTWVNSTRPTEVVGAQNRITVPLAEGPRFFRLVRRVGP